MRLLDLFAACRAYYVTVEKRLLNLLVIWLEASRYGHKRLRRGSWPRTDMMLVLRHGQRLEVRRGWHHICSITFRLHFDVRLGDF